MLAWIFLKYCFRHNNNIARNVVRWCVHCFRCKLVVVKQIIGDLRKDKIEPVRAFIKYGIDFASFVHIKSSWSCKASPYKGNICIWAFLMIKIMYIDLVENLLTEAILNALNGFLIDVVYAFRLRYQLRWHQSPSTRT